MSINSVEAVAFEKEREKVEARWEAGHKPLRLKHPHSLSCLLLALELGAGGRSLLPQEALSLPLLLFLSLFLFFFSFFCEAPSGRG